MFDPYLLAATPLKVSIFTGTTDSSYILLVRLILFKFSQILGNSNFWARIFTLTSLSCVIQRSLFISTCSIVYVNLFISYRDGCNRSYVTTISKVHKFNWRGVTLFTCIRMESSWRCRVLYRRLNARASMCMCVWRPVSIGRDSSKFTCRDSMCLWFLVWYTVNDSVCASNLLSSQ